MQKQTPPLRKIRAAIYSRKSNTTGLGGDFSSLDSQRQACESYVESQRALGWTLVPHEYSDGGYSGANTDRPGFQRLLSDIHAGNIDVVIVYKIDRLSRSLRDFGQLMDLFEQHDVSFVSITQRFDTTSSMGKLTLNVLMSFSEFERDVTRERILDKISAAKRKGKHCGGIPPLGYDIDPIMKRLIVNAAEAKLVKHIFRRFRVLRSVTTLARELNEQGHLTKMWTTKSGITRPGGPWNKGHIYKLLHRRLYLGQVDHKGKIYDGEHDAIISQREWDQAHAVLEEQHHGRANSARAKSTALLKGVIRCVHCDCSMSPSFSVKRAKQYAYYVCAGAAKRGYGTCPVKSVAAGEIESVVVEQLRSVFRCPELIARTYRATIARRDEEIVRLREGLPRLERQLATLTRKAERLVEMSGAAAIAEELHLTGDDLAAAKERVTETRQQLQTLERTTLTETDVAEALERIDPIWDELFPIERNRIVRELIERVDVKDDGIEIRLRAAGLHSLVAELRAEGSESSEACAG